jgi:hypothetical protein
LIRQKDVVVDNNFSLRNFAVYLVVIPFIVSVGAGLVTPRLENKFAAVNDRYRRQSEERRKESLALFAELEAHGLLTTYLL